MSQRKAKEKSEAPASLKKTSKKKLEEEFDED